MDPTRAVARKAFLVGATFEGALIVVAFVGAFITQTPLLTQLRGTWQDVVAALIVTAAMIPFAFLTRAARSGPLARIREIIEQHLVPLFGNCTWDELLALALLAGVGEELLFRGWLQVWLTGYMGPIGALVTASVLFGAVHAVTRAYAVLATLIGALLGALLIWSDGVLAPILVHALYDFVALLVLLRRRP